MKKIIIDDGFNPEFVETAFFDGILEMPCIGKPDNIFIPEAVIPFSKRTRSVEHREFLTFYEYDVYMAFQKGTQTALHGGTVPPQAGM